MSKVLRRAAIGCATMMVCPFQLYAQDDGVTRESYTPPPVEAFAKLPALRDLEVAPNGKYISAFVENDGLYTLTVFEWKNDVISPILQLNDDEEVKARWADWASADRLLVSYRFAAERFDTETTETRLFSMRPDGSRRHRVISNRRSELPVQIEDNIIDFLPQEPNRVLIAFNRNNPGSPEVWKVDVTGGSPERVQGSRRNVSDWETDANGVVRIGVGVKNEREPVLEILTEDGKWLNFDHRVFASGKVFDPVEFTSDPNIIYVRSDHEGGPTGLYKFDIESDQFVEKIFQHESLDVLSPVFSPDRQTLRGVSYGEGMIWLDASFAEEIDLLEYSLESNVKIVDETPNGDYAVVFVTNENNPGSYYIYDRTGPQLLHVGDTLPQFSSLPRATVLASSYSARDGLTIPSYVTLPPWISSLDEARDLPFVIHPHGGPTARDFAQFDPWTQYFASRGYGVLQMNFRGSAGYGEEFRAAGDEQWGQEMQDDITDGVEWLISNGHADANRIAIVGASYGGYAALMGAVKTPDLYQCAVSFAGVSDLPRILDNAKDFVDGEYRTRHIGRIWKDREMLRENSPARRAEDIQIPVLLVHGEDDRVVPIDQSERMARALERAGVIHKYVELENGDHGLTIGANSLRFFQEMDAFLSDCLN